MTVYKKGYKDSPTSYRPISLLPVFAKVFETIIYFQLVTCNYFEEHSLINELQFGFRKSKLKNDAIENLAELIF